jgi:glycosyltransferase involved in cell wall biosynthesis
MQLEVGVNLAGYFDSALGLGQVARRLRAALESQGVPVAPVGLTAANAPRVDEPDRGLVSPGDARHPVNVICVNPDGLAGARDELGPAFFQGRKTIGVWWWESGPVPERWLRAFDHVDELWAGSAHVAEALAAVAPVPVVRVPLPVTLPESDADRGRLGLPHGFLFLASFDYNSVLERKNPLGAVRAFAASGAAERGASLVLKSIGAADRPDAQEQVAAEAAAVPGVQLFDRVLSDRDQAALLRACDCYLSLHRSEGFGLPLAEAMLLGKPVIATGYSGPLDYLTPANSYLVDWHPVAIGPGNDPYPADGTWAEPDLEQAARLIGELLSDPDEARTRGARAREDIERDHSLEAAGAAMAARLRRLALLPTDHNGRVRPLDLGELELRLAGEPPSPAPDVALRRLRRLVRTAVLRATRMQQTHQRQVGEDIAAALRSLDERVQGVAAAQATVQGQLAALERRLAELERGSGER